MNLSTVDESTDANQELQLPFIPLYQYRLQFHHVSLWIFEKQFCQSNYGRHSGNSNACTLITILNAAAIVKHSIEMNMIANKLPFLVVRSFAESIVHGNTIYNHLTVTNQLPHTYLNIPEAMSASAHITDNHIEEWTSFVHQRDMGEFLFEALTNGYEQWCNGNGQLRNQVFVVLIAACRSLLLVFQVNNVTLFDSHQHSPDHGSCIVQTTNEHLENLCEWIRLLFEELYQLKPDCFELSFIQQKCT